MKRDSSLERVIIAMAFGLLLADILTGFFVFQLGLDTYISLIYRVCFLLVCFSYLSINDKRNFAALTGLVFIFFFCAIARNILFEAKFLIEDVSDLLKLLGPIVVFCAVSRFKTCSPFDFVSRFATFNLILLIVNLSLSFIASGKMAYDNFGAKGFLYSANSQSALWVMFSIFFLNSQLKKGLGIFLSVWIILLILSLLMGTKVAVVGIFLIGVVQLASKRSGILLFFIAGFPLYLYLSVSEAFFGFFSASGFFSRIAYFYETGGIVKMVFSGRDQFLFEIYDGFGNGSIANILFGMGAGSLSDFLKPKVEMDAFDIVFRFGILLSVIYFFLIGFILFHLFFMKGPSTLEFLNLKNSVSLMSIFLVLVGFLSGHVFINGVVNFSWACLLAVPFWCKNFLSVSRVDGR